MFVVSYVGFVHLVTEGYCEDNKSTQIRCMDKVVNIFHFAYLNVIKSLTDSYVTKYFCFYKI